MKVIHKKSQLALSVLLLATLSGCSWTSQVFGRTAGDPGQQFLQGVVEAPATFVPAENGAGGHFRVRVLGEDGIHYVLLCSDVDTVEGALSATPGQFVKFHGTPVAEPGDIRLISVSYLKEK